MKMLGVLLGSLQHVLDEILELVALIGNKIISRNQRKRPKYLTFCILMDVGSTPAASTNVLFINYFK